MSSIYTVTAGLRGMFRDVLRDPAGRVTWDSGWHNNTIVNDCHRLLAALLRGAPNASGLQGLLVGSGSDAWDQQGNVPVASSSQTRLVDPQPFLAPADNSVPGASFKVEYLVPNTATVTTATTNRIQIVITLGPSAPNWPSSAHPSSTLREFGLVAKLDNQQALVNYVIHPAIAKDLASTLERTIWLVL